MDNEQRILALLEKYQNGNASKAELRELDDWYSSFENIAGLTDGLDPKQEAVKFEQHLSRMNMRLDREFVPAKKQPSLWPRILVAASILIAVSIGFYFFSNKPSEVQTASNTLTEDFVPGGNKAVLTLANGQKINLDDAANGKLANEGNVIINKTADGEVAYGGSGDAVAVTNTMSTPRGGQYHLRLSDGTDVWLNAASSISYPSAFTGNSREVEVSGEVYFEVAHNAAKPFRVKSAGQIVEVLGTHFNVNTYKDGGSLKTTLLEGSVAVSANGKRVLIKPGQQAVNTDGNLNVRSVETSEEVAWKDGYFDFTDADIQTVMQQISRWYDVDVEFVGTMSKETFTGRISRSRNISKVLKIVESSKSVRLTYSGRRIMVKM